MVHANTKVPVLLRCGTVLITASTPARSAAGLSTSLVVPPEGIADDHAGIGAGAHHEADRDVDGDDRSWARFGSGTPAARWTGRTRRVAGCSDDASAGGAFPTVRSVAYPTPYANPFRPRIRSREANAAAVERYRPWLLDRLALVARARRELAGRDLARWCPTDPGSSVTPDVLLDVANQAQNAADISERA
jgi:uncharacterized protein DUF4326